MARPKIKHIAPFDAGEDHDIILVWSGNRAHANRIIIRDNETNTEVFNDVVSSFALTHTIPADTLQNGRKYIIQACVYDEENVESPLSEKVLFYTFSTPEYYFDNLPADSILTNSSFTASIHYYSSDWEDIGKYIFYLYDSSGKQLLTSSEMTDSAEIEYTYRGLDNNTAYYIRWKAVTVNGMELDTGCQQVFVKFENPNTYARIYATPVPSQGCIQVATNLIVIQYNGTDNFDYIDGMIDLRDKTLYYDEGFLIKDDFSVIIRGVHLWQNADILKMKNDVSGLTLSSHIYTDGKLRFRLLVPNGVGNYLLYSEPLVFENNDMVTIAIRRKGSVYQLKTFLEIGYTTEGDMWYGSDRPSRQLMNDNDSWIDTEGDTYVVSKENYTSHLDEEEPADAVMDDLWLGGE